MTSKFRLVLPLEIYQAILDQARLEMPSECCGLLAGIAIRQRLLELRLNRRPTANSAQFDARDSSWQVERVDKRNSSIANPIRFENSSSRFQVA